VSLLWAKIHEDLAQVYIHRFASGATGLTRTAWYSQRSDSGQRDLLKKTIERMDIRGAATFPTAKEDLVWSIERINALSKIRNDAIHAAVVLIWGEGGATVSPDPWTADPRSEKLQNLDLTVRLKACQKDLEALIGFNRWCSPASSIRAIFRHGRLDRTSLPQTASSVRSNAELKGML
jgi:hypothetical protein